MKRFEVFKPGSHTSANGVALTFTEQDLAATVAAYDPAIHEAPIVVGHPKDNHPAYGWVKKLEFSDGKLHVEPAQVDPDFAEMVAAGRFKKRSASFYAPESKANPVPGTYYLRHVGFLGAQPPAVKGLKDVSFAASDDDGVVEFAEDWVTDGLIARLFRGLREYIISKDGQDKADQTLPSYAISDLEQMAREAQPKPNGAIAQPMFTEEPSMTPEQIAALQAKADAHDKLAADFAELKKAHDAQTVEFAELKTKQASADAAAALVTIKAAIEPHVKAGKVLPAEVDNLAAFAQTLDDKTESFDFKEGDQTKKVSARALFLSQLALRPVAVDFSERAPGGDGSSEGLSQKQLADRARAHKAKIEKDGGTISYTEAVDAVIAGRDK